VTANLENQRQQITQSDQQLRASLGWTSILALLMGTGISALTLVNTARLERQTRISEAELRRLSGQLRTTQEQERKLLSRELHDQVGQLLVGLKLELNAIQSGVTEPERLLRVGSAKHTVERIMNTVRNIAMLLRPSMLDDLGLVPALTWLCREVSRSSGIEVAIEADKALNDLPEAYRTCLYRTVQEGLTNASHHSGARKMQVVVTMNRSEVAGNISDDGCGFDPELSTQRGLGLIGMQERVRDLHGKMRIVSFPGRGTQIEIRLPRPAAEVLDGEDSNSGRSRHRADGLEASA
jgi:signal transduction histidine kinase